jgi:hypothetical protein
VAARVSRAGLALLASLWLAACGTSAATPASPRPAASIGPAQTVSAAVGLTRGDLVRALGAKQLVLTDTQSPFRPVEGPALTVAPRAVYQVTLPDDPTKGFIVVYEFSDSAQAAAAGADQAAYLASGPGRIQAPDGEIHILRQVGSTIVFYSWIPEGARDARAPGIQAALETLGLGIPIPG